MTQAPPFIHDYELLQATAQGVLADRERDYPQLVEGGKMAPEQAAEGLRIMRSIVADWQRIVDLRAGRTATPIDASATDFEKRGTLSYVHQRALKHLAKAVADARALMSPLTLAAIDQGFTSRSAIEARRTIARDEWKRPEIGAFLAFERRSWQTASLLWHAERWPMAMIYAEMQAELIGRNALAAAA